MSNPDWRPRITLDVSEELYYEIQRVIPRGLRRPLLEVVMEDILKILKGKSVVDKEKILALVIERQVSIPEIMPSLREG